MGRPRAPQPGPRPAQVLRVTAVTWPESVSTPIRFSQRVWDAIALHIVEWLW